MFAIVSFFTPRVDAQIIAKVNPWSGFFKPVNAVLPVKVDFMKSGDVSTSSQWLFRPSIFITADAVCFSGGAAVTQPLSSVGTGISYSNFITVNGQPYSQVSVSALLMTNINLNGSALTQIGGGVIVGAFDGLVNLGGAIIGGKTYLLLGTTLKI